MSHTPDGNGHTVGQRIGYTRYPPFRRPSIIRGPSEIHGAGHRSGFFISGRTKTKTNWPLDASHPNPLNLPRTEPSVATVTGDTSGGAGGVPGGHEVKDHDGIDLDSATRVRHLPELRGSGGPRHVRHRCNRRQHAMTTGDFSRAIECAAVRSRSTLNNHGRFWRAVSVTSSRSDCFR
jgi:hypothetical protein